MKADGEVAQGGWDQRCVAGAQPVVVLARDDVSNPVEAVLYRQVPLGSGGDRFGRGVGYGRGAEPGGPPRWSSSCRRCAC